MKVEIYSIPNCPYCTKAKALAENHQKVTEVVYNMMGKDYEASEVRELFPTARTFPQIIVDDEKIGGYMDLEKLLFSQPT
jgi:glutaredoxin|tara:strand:- start:143 stop:382 length:240 start_codon:yes stop_codon:yes gene_type:complete